MGTRRTSSFKNIFGQPTDEDRLNIQQNSVFESEASVLAARGEAAEAVQEFRQQRTRRATRNSDGPIYVNTRAGISLGSVAMDAAGRQGAQQNLAVILDRLDNTRIAAIT